MCWFGPHDIKKNQIIQKCIASWHTYMGDYTIMEWTESNIDIGSLPAFAQNAYKNKKWAYVADVVRFQKLYEYGGIYLDTDMLILKDMSPLLEKDYKNNSDKSTSCNDTSIWGYEDDTHISCGIIATNKNNKLIKEISDFYINHYRNNNLNHIIAVPKIVSDIINKNKIADAKFEKEIKIYSQEYFYPLPNTNKKEDYNKFITNNSYAVHLWNYSWQPWYMKALSELGIVQIGKAILRGKIRIVIKKLLRLG